MRGWLLRATGSISNSARGPGLGVRETLQRDASLTAAAWQVFDSAARKTDQERDLADLQ